MRFYHFCSLAYFGVAIALRAKEEDDYDIDFDDDFDLGDIRGKRRITGDDPLPVFDRKKFHDASTPQQQTRYEMMPVSYYASMDSQHNHPIPLNEVEATMNHILQADVYPLLLRRLPSPQKGWTIALNNMKTRVDGSPTLAMVHIDNIPGDMLVRKKPKDNEVEILAMTPDLKIGPEGMNRLNRLLLSSAETRKQIVKDNFLRGGQGQFGIEMRRSLVCDQPQIRYVPNSPKLAETEKRITVMTRVLLVRLWESSSRKTSDGKNNPRFLPLSHWETVSVEGSIPISYSGTSRQSRSTVDDVSLKKIEEFTGYALKSPQLDYRCRDIDVTAQEGIKDICIHMFGTNPVEISHLSKTPDAFAIQCLGLYPVGTWSIYHHQRNVKGGVHSEYRIQTCLPDGWSKPQRVDEMHATTLMNKCRSSTATDLPFEIKSSQVNPFLAGIH
eukprot:GHVO01044089.1.p1 GENE.GHVO01044089.1~~GHVO01044089.1.p1  ORF type:complete len:451 (-),score=53.91 GHVO01044089.1:146-1471(-)